MTTIVKNELLCFVQNMYGNFPTMSIVNVISNFFDDDEIVSSEKLVHEIIVKAVGGIEAPRYCTRKASDNKRKLECEVLLKWFSLVDENNIDIPSFAAVNLARIP